MERQGKRNQSETDENFPVGMRVLAVDDDPVCLKMLESLLRKCRYKVTAASQAVAALELLRQKRGEFDIVITDVNMPDMDGFKLLEIVGLEMDLPVIMISASSEVSKVMEGVKHGACDYLVKPIRIQELKNIWQHVARKTFSEEAGDSACKPPTTTCSDEDSSAQKKQRVSWKQELHLRFCDAIEMLGGVEKAVPKKILDVMGVPGLTRENIASHLQKYRTALKKRTNKSGDPSIGDDAALTACGNLNGNVRSFGDESLNRLNNFEGSSITGCNNNHSRPIQFACTPNSHTCRGLHVNIPSVPLNSQNHLPSQYLGASQVFHRNFPPMQQVIPNLPINGPSYQPVPLRPSQYLPGHTTGFGLGPSSFASMSSNEIGHHDPIFGGVQSALPGQYQKADLSIPNDTGSLDLLAHRSGVVPDVQNCSGFVYTGCGLPDGVEAPPEFLETEAMLQPGNSISSDELNAAVKQFCRPSDWNRDKS